MSFFFGLFIVFIYLAAPSTIGEIPSKAASTVENVVTKGQVITGTYEIDQKLYAEGIAAFRQQNYPLARDLLMRSDPEERDANVQFYIAYSFYRQGWGRISNDDALFTQGIAAADRARAIAPDLRSADTDLQLRTPAELRAEMEEGLKVTADDFNPLRVFRERK